ncbi:LrgB family protein [Derxia lacustris]|uniref:LrgB family protein n=1 Tax=Derxia lacustris TaxID=764842 RepID=UPI000A1778E8|nr:LrgB family protein [Derxia lacustris]
MDAAFSLATGANLLLWPAATIGVYWLAKLAYRRVRQWWAMPLLLAPVLLLGLALMAGARYDDYMRGSHFLLLMLGPATVAFALPIYERRALIARHWKVLAVGVCAGSGMAMTSAWLLATWLHLSPALRLSLLPRSISTPFAIVISGDVGGVPDLTAVFVIMTGVFGAATGGLLLRWLPLRSAVARGALFGMGAHGAGVTRAMSVGDEEGSIAGLTMVLAGLLNVAVAPLLAQLLG